MTDNQQRLGLIILLAAGFTLFALASWWKERRRNRLPVIEVEATVLSKRVVTQTHRSTYGRVNGHYYYVTFRCANGDVLELPAPEGAGGFPEGERGILTYQGKKMEKFVPYE